MEEIRMTFYRVNRIDFKYNENIKPDTKFQLKPRFECKMGVNGKMLFVNLGVAVLNEEANPTPFDLKVNLVGGFTMGDFAPEDNKIRLKACLRQLMPYLHSTVASITADCNIPAYFLPIIDVNEMVNLSKENEPGANFDLGKTNIN